MPDEEALQSLVTDTKKFISSQSDDKDQLTRETRPRQTRKRQINPSTSDVLLPEPEKKKARRTTETVSKTKQQPSRSVAKPNNNKNNNYICKDCKKRGHQTKRSKDCDKYKLSPLERKFGKNTKLEFFTVKIGFNKIYTDDLDKQKINEKEKKRRKTKEKNRKKVFKTIKEAILDDVDVLSKLEIEFSILFEFLIRHPGKWLLNYLNQQESTPRFEFLLRFMQKNNPNSKDYPDVVDLVDEFRGLLPGDPRPAYDTEGRHANIDEYHTQFMTNLRVNITTHGFPRIVKYFKKIKNLSDAEAKKITAYIFRDRKDPKDDDEIEDENLLLDDNNDNDDDDERDALVDERNVFLDDDELFSAHSGLKFSELYTKWWKFFPFFMDLQKFINFKLTPVHQPGLKHVAYTTSGIYLLLRRVFGDIGAHSQRATAVDDGGAQLLWNKIIKLPKRLDKKFAFRITTQGIDVSILCARKVPNSSVTNQNLPKVDIKKVKRVCGFDPGLKNGLGGFISDQKIEEIGDKNKDKRFLLKSTSWYHRTGAYWRAEKRKKMADDYLEKFRKELLSQEQYRDINLNEPDNYINIAKFRLTYFDEAQKLYSKRKLARLSWDKYIQTSRETDKLINFIVTGQRSRRELKRIERQTAEPRTEKQILKKEKKNRQRRLLKKKRKELLAPVRKKKREEKEERKKLWLEKFKNVKKKKKKKKKGYSVG